MKVHNFIKDTKGMAQIESDAKKKRASFLVKQNEQVEESNIGATELPERKGRKKKAQAET